MEKVTGRTDDMIILRGVNLFPTQIEELILRIPGLSPHYQCVLTRPNRMDEMTVRVEARDAETGTEERSRLATELAGHVKHTIGVTVAVDVVEPSVLGRSSGKLNRILDER
jgi:phenylacetate-CoA ligase